MAFYWQENVKRVLCHQKNLFLFIKSQQGLAKGRKILWFCFMDLGLLEMVPIAQFWAKSIDNTLFLMPDAPFPFDQAPPGYGGRQWFSLRNYDPEVIKEGLETVEPMVNRFIDEQIAAWGVTNSRCVIGGFSQGSAVALHVGLRRVRPACIVSLSGGVFYPEPETQLGQPPVILLHGSEDPIVSIDVMHASQHYLWTKGIDVETYVCEGIGHSVSEEGLRRSGAFIKKHLHV